MKIAEYKTQTQLSFFLKLIEITHKE